MRLTAMLLAYVLIVACGGGETRSLKIGPDVFASREDGTAPNEVIVLSGAFEVDVAVAALRRAGDRFMFVDNRGMEYMTEADVEAAEERYATGDFYTPNYVADPKVLDHGIELYVDCKGVIPPPMAATFRKILREELERSGITNATVKNAPT
jgi:hypothetical protein